MLRKILIFIQNRTSWLNILGLLAEAGIRNTKHVFEHEVSWLLKALVPEDDIREILVSLADLIRIRWVGPTFVGLCVAAGFDSVAKLQSCNAVDFFRRIKIVNEEQSIYKGDIFNPAAYERWLALDVAILQPLPEKMWILR